ncbi:MAG: retroviral-like aspartic protease family protein [Vicinamibacterales bacterium]
MQTGRPALALTAVLAASAFVLGLDADVTKPSQSAEIQIQLGNQLFQEGRYIDAVDAFQLALDASAPDDRRPAQEGLTRAALRIARFNVARTTAADVAAASPRDPEALSLYGDALWASGLFQEAEAQYQAALAIEPQLARGRHGTARSLAARSQLDAALAEGLAALALAPRDMEIHHTLGGIYERLRRYEEAALSFSSYLNLLPNRDTSDQADWSRSEIRFLRSFGRRTPFEMDEGAADQNYTVGFRLVNDKIVIRARVNDGPLQDFVVDTGAENTLLTGPVAQRLGVTPVTYTLSAGVGDLGLRGLQLGRIDTLDIGGLQLRNVPTTIKDPPLRNLPTSEPESLSPLSLGFSMIIDYATRQITFGKHLPEEPADFELPLRMHRLAMVRGTVDRTFPTNFVVDTGGQVISISQATVSALGREPERRIGLQVFGSSGWDRDAFLLPGVDLLFDQIRYDNFPVVVLNLNTPSALLGVQLGGIVGHRFLSQYRVAIDMERSVLRLKAL